MPQNTSHSQNIIQLLLNEISEAGLTGLESSVVMNLLDVSESTIYRALQDEENNEKNELMTKVYPSGVACNRIYNMQ